MRLYKYDETNLVYKQIKFMDKFKFIIIIFLIFSLFGFTTANTINSELEKIPVIIKLQEEKFSEEKLIAKLKDMNIQHVDIVLAQAKLESDNYTSIMFKRNNNSFGMKCPSSRATTKMGEHNGHSLYKHWEDSVNDYALWQSSYARNLSKSEYYQLLDAIYAEDGSYSIKIKGIIAKQLNKK